ncbi:MAG: xanthine dehydrogenase family protein subunit M, partial [Deltaproteobacteria bacterium]|nr:xanthine dehydrogenase family protein subunit M [Deltaproteobacteria bacterium]
AATPLRCTKLEAYLQGRTLAAVNPAELRAAQAADLQPIDDVRSTASYRAEVFARLVEQALRETHLAASH